MAGLPWVRLDAAFPTNPKVLRLSSSRTATGPGSSTCAHSPTPAPTAPTASSARAALPFIHGRKADAERLVSVGLWHVYPDGGWLINGWDDKQVTNEAARLRSQLAKKAAAARWHPPDQGSAHA